MISEKEKQRISKLSCQLHSIIRTVSVLKPLRWDASVKQKFFLDGAKELPVVKYDEYDAREKLTQLGALENQLQDSIFDQWLKKHIDVAKTTLRMLSSLGTNAFSQYSISLYGQPQQHLNDGENTPLELATEFHNRLEGASIPLQAEKLISSSEAKRIIEQRVNEMFGTESPKVLVSGKLSANASASSKRIRLRKEANFNLRDIEQLIQHEASIHVATSLNGKSQQLLPTLGSSHAGTTKTQEGLAVFAEFITGTMDVNRMRRLSDRLTAIHMSIQGADFIEVYQYFLEQTGGDEDQSFENTHRVFRGGVLTGGAPFTKDIVYLDGLVRVHNFFRVAVAANRADVIPLLFSGKLDLDDLLVIAEMRKSGLCQAPKFLPSWVADMNFLFSYMAYSSFLNQINLHKVTDHYSKILTDLPII